jgi:hypothetical protein
MLRAAFDRDAVDVDHLPPSQPETASRPTASSESHTRLPGAPGSGRRHHRLRAKSATTTRLIVMWAMAVLLGPGGRESRSINPGTAANSAPIMPPPMV